MTKPTSNTGLPPESKEAIERKENAALAEQLASSLLASAGRVKEAANAIEASLANTTSKKARESVRRWIKSYSQVERGLLKNQLIPTNADTIRHLKKTGQDEEELLAARDGVIEEIMKILENETAAEDEYKDPKTGEMIKPNNADFVDLDGEGKLAEELESLEEEILNYDKKTYPPVQKWRRKLKKLRDRMNPNPTPQDRAATLAHLARVDGMISARASYDPGGILRNDPESFLTMLEQMGIDTSPIRTLAKKGQLKPAPPGTKHVNDVPRDGVVLALRGAGLVTFGILFVLCTIISGKKIKKEKLGLSDGFTLAYGYMASKLAGINLLPSAKQEYENTKKILALRDDSKFAYAAKTIIGKNNVAGVAEALHDQLNDSENRGPLRNLIEKNQEIRPDQIKGIVGETDPMYIAAKKCKTAEDQKKYRHFLHELTKLDIQKDNQVTRIRMMLEQYL